MKQSQIHLEKVTEDNVEDIVKLRVAKEQKEYVASNEWSLVDAYLSLAKGEPVFPFDLHLHPVPERDHDGRSAPGGKRHDASVVSSGYDCPDRGSLRDSDHPAARQRPVGPESFLAQGSPALPVTVRGHRRRGLAVRMVQ